MQNILNHISDRSSHLTGKRGKNNNIFQCSVPGSYCTVLSYHVTHDVLVCLHLFKRKLKCFISDQSLALLYVLRINQVSDLSLRLWSQRKAPCGLGDVVE